MAWLLKPLNKTILLSVVSILFCSQCVAADSKNLVKFEKQKLTLGDKTLSVEMALNSQQRQQGLMYRKKLAEGEGMLFVFPQVRVLSFWMKNTLIPLSIGYFTADKRLVQILDMEPESQMIQDAKLKKYPSKVPVKYALEVPRGWFSKNKIKIGTSFKLNSKSPR